MRWLAALSPFIRLLVRWRLGPYRVTINRVDPAAPLRVGRPRKVAVIGGGIAGVAAASTLGARGYAVTLFEAKPYLGGKLGSWPVELAPGDTQWVSHGYHAFFRHYYNLNRFLGAMGARPKFKAISDYRILLADGGDISCGELETTPVLNLLSMAWRHLYRLRDVLKAPTRDVMGVFLEYDGARSDRQLDGLSFADFNRRAQLPARLKVIFNTFARAFFADESRLSMAALVKAFHFYFLGHDGGLVYDYPAEDYEASLWKPIRAHLGASGVDLRLSTRVARLERDARGLAVNGERFDAVVLAADVVGTREILGAAVGLDTLDERFSTLAPGQRYAVLRVWLDKRARESLPVFVATERVHLLDAIAFYDRAEAESGAWVRAHGGSVVELHCYAVPDDVAAADVGGLLLEDLVTYLPELRGTAVRHQHFALERNFPAFHVGMSASRPETDTGVDGLFCAGDWVKLPFPAMLLEAAFASGLLAANRILARDGLREEPVESVPLRGLLAGLSAPPARRRLLGLPGPETAR